MSLFVELVGVSLLVELVGMTLLVELVVEMSLFVELVVGVLFQCLSERSSIETGLRYSLTWLSNLLV